MTMSLDKSDRAILLATQEGLPLVPEPYAAVATAVGLSEKEVMERLARLCETGIIRRIAAVPNHYALGYRFNGMTVWDVADRDAATAGAILSKVPFVSHCYQRPRHLPIWPYNIFAMIHARDQKTAIDQVDCLSKALGALSRRHQVLFSTRILKKTGLRLSG